MLTLDGLDEVCESVGTRVIGGNLKEGQRVDISGTAIGVCRGLPLTRSGASPGEFVVAFGDLGLFWAGFLAVTRELQSLPLFRSRLEENLLKPAPKIAVGKSLREAGVLSSCMDNSDGLYPSATSIARASGVGLSFDFSQVQFEPAVAAVGAELGVDPVRLSLGWGDWQLVATTAPRDLGVALDIARDHGVSAAVIGEVTSGSQLLLRLGSMTQDLPAIDSQRFASDSWFSAGIESYVARLLTPPPECVHSRAGSDLRICMIKI